MTKRCIIPIFVPHLGCPHDCVFCNQRKITNSASSISLRVVENTIKEHLNYFRPNSLVEIAFYGGSFTAIDIDIQNELLSLAYEYKQKAIIDEIRLSTRPDAISPVILENLQRYGVNTIELGVQSLDDIVLNASGRGHSSDDVYKAIDLIRRYKFKLGLQMMVGLPKDTLEKNINTANKFIEVRPDFVRIYPTLVIKDTFLENLEIQKKYEPLSLDEAIYRVSPIMKLFYLNDINIIRVGLQSTENIQLGKDVVSGPFHPSFRQLVDANIYREILTSYFDKSRIETKNKILEIHINNKEISNLVGQKSSNTKFLMNKYNFSQVKFIGSKALEGKLIIKVGNYIDEVNIKLLIKNSLTT